MATTDRAAASNGMDIVLPNESGSTTPSHPDTSTNAKTASPMNTSPSSQNDIEKTTRAPPDGSTGGLREWAGVLVLCCAMLLTQSALAQTVINQPAISATFAIDGQPGQQSWLTSSFSLTVGTFVLPSGRLGDMYGHRRMVQLGFAWFAAMELVAGLLGQYTTSAVGFDVVRGLMGIGPAMLLPNSIAVLARLNPPGSLAKMVSFCIYAATAPNGFVLGAVFSALLSRTVGWWWSFYVFAVVLVVLLAVTFAVIPSDEAIERRVQMWQKAGADDNDGVPSLAQQRFFDPIGTVVGVSGLVLFNFAFNQALVVGWQTAYVYALLIVGVLLMAAFVVVERHVKDPLVPPGMFQLRTSLVLGCIALGWSSFGIWLVYGNQFLSQLRGHSPLSIAAQYVPCGVAGVVAAFSSVFLLRKVSAAWVMLGAMSAFCTGNALLATMPVAQSYWIQFFIAVVVTPFGMDMSFPSASIIISDALSAEQQGAAGSLVNTVVNYSIAFGLGLAGTVELHVDDTREDGFRGALYMGVGLAGLGVACACALLVLEMRRRHGR